MNDAINARCKEVVETVMHEAKNQIDQSVSKIIEAKTQELVNELSEIQKRSFEYQIDAAKGLLEIP